VKPGALHRIGPPKGSSERFRPRMIAGEHAYDQLVQAIEDRRKHLGLSCEQVDDLAGVPDRYYVKLANSLRGYGRLSLGLVLQSLGISLLLVADDRKSPAEIRHERRAKAHSSNGGSSGQAHAA
jgi:hypothetical protein